MDQPVKSKPRFVTARETQKPYRISMFPKALIGNSQVGDIDMTRRGEHYSFEVDWQNGVVWLFEDATTGHVYTSVIPLSSVQWIGYEAIPPQAKPKVA